MSKKFTAVINCTHSGYVNKNNTWYLEKDMADAIDSWTGPYQKPVLTHHEMKKDAIGRVTSAKYINMKDSKGKNAPKGYIQLETEITDTDAQTKIKDKRYNTVSISTDASVAICSICNQDIAKDGLCEHERGKKYNGKKCFWYLGGLKYKEVSYVNAPADEYAETERFEEKEVTMNLTDSVEQPTTTIKNCEEMENFTDEDLSLAHWLTIEIDNELSEEDRTISNKTKEQMKTLDSYDPEKSFPVIDCTRIVDAERLMEKYKGNGNKTKILNYIKTQAKAMGCDSIKDSLTMEVDSMVITLKDALEVDEVRSHIDSEILKATQSYKDQLVGMSVLAEKVTKLEKDTVAKDAELTSSKDLIKRLEDSVTSLKTEVHGNLVNRVFDLRKNLQKKDVISLKDGQEVEVFKAELAKRTDESLKDAIADLSKEVAVEIPVTTTVTPTNDGIVDEHASTQDTEKTVPTNKSRKEIVKDLIFKD